MRRMEMRSLQAYVGSFHDGNISLSMNSIGYYATLFVCKLVFKILCGIWDLRANVWGLNIAYFMIQNKIDKDVRKL